MFTYDWWNGFLFLAVPVMFAILMAYAHDYREKYGYKPYQDTRRPTLPPTPPLINAEFVTKSDSEALVRQGTRVVVRPKQVTGRQHGE